MRLLVIADFTEQFAYRILRGIQHYSQESGEPWVVRRMPPSFRREQGFKKVVSWAKQWQADAVLGIFDPDDDVALFRQNGMAAMAIDNISPFSAIPNLTANYEKMGRMAAARFMERGFRHFAFFGYRGVCWSDGRRKGFRECLEEAGFGDSLDEGDRIRGENFFWNFDQAKIYQWLLSLRKPVGIMTSDDTQATILIETCNRYGLRVPFDVSIIGVDNDEMLCTLSEPGISSVDVDLELGGYKAAALLSRMVREPDYPGEDIVMEPLRLVLRGSSDVVATTDEAVRQALEFIHGNLSHKIQVSNVLEHVPVSRRLLEQRFLKATGTTLYHYISKMRVVYFAQQLLQSNEAVSNIAARMDEPDAKSLARRFQAVMGCTPTEYRRRNLRKLG